jgi:hypothetical protein
MHPQTSQQSTFLLVRFPTKQRKVSSLLVRGMKSKMFSFFGDGPYITTPKIQVIYIHVVSASNVCTSSMLLSLNQEVRSCEM